MKDNINFKLLNLLILITIVCLIYFIKGLWIRIISSLFKIVSPFILAFGLAYILYPFVKKIENLGCPKWLAILITCFLIISFLILIIALTIPLLYDQILLFISDISIFLSNISIKYKLNFNNIQSTLIDLSSDIISNIGSRISNGAINIINSSISVITSGILIFCSAVYFLIDMEKIRKVIKKHLNSKNKKIVKYLKLLDTEMIKYISGIGLNILIQTLEYTFAFFIIGHPNYLILGILSGLSAIIPWFGGFLVAIISLLVSSVISLKMFVLTIAICIICPILDGNVIGPKIYGKTNSLHPLLVIFSISTGGIIAGFWGIVISLPLAIIIKTTYKFYKNNILKGTQKNN